MFGYVKPDNPNMYVKDTVLYRSLYCGLCKSIGQSCGSRARLCLSYDLTFLSAFMHNLMDNDIKIEKQRCVVHWIRKRPVAVPDELSKRIANLNVILTFHKLNDDVLDCNRGRTKRSFFKKAYKKAKRKEPCFDEIVTKYFAKLVEYEKTKGDSIDLASDPFATMMQQLVYELAKRVYNESLADLSYNLGKWVYLIDALDDFDKDIKNDNYNVFVNLFNDCSNKCQLLKQHFNEIEMIFAQIISCIIENGKKLDYKFNHDLTDNIMFCGIKAQTKMIMENKTCKKTTKS